MSLEESLAKQRELQKKAKSYLELVGPHEVGQITNILREREMVL